MNNTELEVDICFNIVIFIRALNKVSVYVVFIRRMTTIPHILEDPHHNVCGNSKVSLFVNIVTVEFLCSYSHASFCS
jgi:hypothetical protein